MLLGYSTTQPVATLRRDQMAWKSGLDMGQSRSSTFFEAVRLELRCLANITRAVASHPSAKLVSLHLRVLDKRNTEVAP
jgi:hypothetical protein